MGMYGGSRSKVAVGRSPNPLVFAIGFATALSVTATLSWSDRAPMLVRDAAFRLDIDDDIHRASLGVDPELVAHAVVWGGLALLVGVAIGGVTARWQRLWLALGCGALVTVSALVEEGQRRFTAVRTFQMKDIVANGIGVLAVYVVLAVVVERRSLVGERRTLVGERRRPVGRSATP